MFIKRLLIGISSKLFFAVAAFACCGCQPASRTRPDTKIAHQIKRENNRKLAKLGLIQCGTGGNVMPTIKIISNGYKTDQYRFTSVEEARVFFCSIFDQYAKPFNENREIRPYLHNFPLNAKNIRLDIEFVDAKGEPLREPYIARVWIDVFPQYTNGFVCYATFNEDSKWFDLIHRETFDRAHHIYLQGAHE